MDFQLTESQQMLQDSAQRFMRQQHGFEQRRALLKEGAGLHAALWQTFAEMGWLALPYPEDQGGLDGSHRDLVQLMSCFGEGLTVEPYSANVLLAGQLISALGSPEQQAALLSPMLTGDMQLAFAHDEPGRRFALDARLLTAARDGDQYRLSGDKAVVLNGDKAQQLVVSARLGEATLLFVVPADAKGLSRRDYPTVDGGSAADLHFDGVTLPASALLGDEQDQSAAIEVALDKALLGLCAEAVGIMAALVSDTVEYCKTRKQFGTPISTFQVLQHRMVDMFMRTEQSRALLEMAAIQADNAAPAEAREALSSLKAWLGSAARYVGQQAVQLHGGMGVTEELRVGHYFKRLTLIQELLGNEDWHLRRLDRLMTEAAA
ncbi:acyl-CoA dehydrogenase family protein [Alcanivorax sp. JB21]|uniref:acyl-CoA dehydrogenase family protein n=1 Tax=Alcanivorax limicola TaxID=2874102 RepID=UPI001CBC1510|nr:acyl-CoA dehydrogenase family protein [Alcanivorax limicola]MBZ2187881.1 acyl-CoA dehydrogenase family protein [Alcanivorax limicola]